jgi:hypothetical protein
MMGEEQETAAMSTESTRGIRRVSEHELLHAAREQVDEALISPTADTRHWGNRLLSGLAQLADAFERHRAAAEAEGGTLDVVVEERPELTHSARRQRREHVDLLADLDAIRRELAAGIEAGRLDPDTFRWRAGTIQDAVRRHMARGNDLLYEAFLRDDGGEG